MGNSSTTLVIRTNSDYGRDGLHHAGTVVTGVAYLHVAQIDYKASSLVVGIKGSEKRVYIMKRKILSIMIEQKEI